ncbi:hypothetical protein F4780DRAFT_281076 [Xylariomycetidae sp. FL0641]|nr:hypothetical protein F4780DRAFT_281076 [Xylariomycetidae sp. FL0641]
MFLLNPPALVSRDPWSFLIPRRSGLDFLANHAMQISRHPMDQMTPLERASLRGNETHLAQVTRTPASLPLQIRAMNGNTKGIVQHKKKNKKQHQPFNYNEPAKQGGGNEGGAGGGGGGGDQNDNAGGTGGDSAGGGDGDEKKDGDGKKDDNPDNEWGGFEPLGKKKKGKNQGEDKTGTAPTTSDTFHEIKLDDMAQPSELSSGGSTGKKATSSFGAWGSSWNPGSWGWGGSKGADKSQGQEEKKDEPASGPWSADRSKPNKNPVGFSFGAMDDVEDENTQEPAIADEKKGNFSFSSASAANDKRKGSVWDFAVDEPPKRQVIGLAAAGTGAWGAATMKGKSGFLNPGPTAEKITETEGNIDEEWGGWGTSSKDRKKKKALLEPVPSADAKAVPEPAPDPPGQNEDDFLDSVVSQKSEKGKKKSRAELDEPAKPELAMGEASNAWSFWGATKKTVKKSTEEPTHENNDDDWANWGKNKDSIEEPGMDNVWKIGDSKKDKKNGSRNLPVDIENGSRLNGPKPDSIEESKGSKFEDDWAWGSSKNKKSPPPAPTPPPLDLDEHGQDLERNVWDDPIAEDDDDAAAEALAAEIAAEEQEELRRLCTKRKLKGKDKQRFDELTANANRRYEEKAAKEAEEQARQEAKEKAASEAREAEEKLAIEVSQAEQQAAADALEAEIAAEGKELATLRNKKKPSRREKQRIDELTGKAKRRADESAAREAEQQALREEEQKSAAEAEEAARQAAADALEAEIAAEAKELASLRNRFKLKKADTVRLRELTEKAEARAAETAAKEAAREAEEQAAQDTHSTVEAEEQEAPEADDQADDQAAIDAERAALEAEIALEEEELGALKTRLTLRGKLKSKDQKRYEELKLKAENPRGRRSYQSKR